MKTRLLFLCLAAVLPFAAGAQTVETGVYSSLGVEYKIAKGLHLTAEEEVRVENNCTSLSSLRTTLGLTYKPSKYVKLGLGYTLINSYSASAQAFKAPRHRAFVEATGYLPAGNFQFSLKEKLQLTHRTGEFNVYQTTPNQLALKSKLGLKYKGWNHFEPGVSAELRVALNNPTLGTLGATGITNSGKTYYEYTPAGYGTADLDRLRLNFSGEIKFNKHHSLTPYLLVDFCSEYEIDTNAEGTRLFSAAYNKYTFLCPGLSYVFSF